MEVKDYCNNLHAELTAWKAKMYDVVQKFERMPENERQKMGGQINALHEIVSDLDRRVEQLQRECPTDWENIRKEISARAQQLGSQFETARDSIWHYPGIGDASKPSP